MLLPLPLPFLELLLVVLSLVVLHASLRVGLSSSWLVMQQLIDSL